jgi:hypothetical protein
MGADRELREADGRPSLSTASGTSGLVGPPSNQAAGSPSGEGRKDWRMTLPVGDVSALGGADAHGSTVIVARRGPLP